jgi:hypothetical protein
VAPFKLEIIHEESNCALGKIKKKLIHGKVILSDAIYAPRKEYRQPYLITT